MQSGDSGKLGHGFLELGYSFLATEILEEAVDAKELVGDGDFVLGVSAFFRGWGDKSFAASGLVSEGG